MSAEEASLREAMSKIHRGLDSHDAYLAIKDTCDDYDARLTLDVIEENALKRFATGTAKTLSETQVMALVAVIKGRACPDAPSAVDPRTNATTQESPTTTFEPAPSVKHQEFSGSGDDIVDVAVDQAALVYFECPACDRNVVVRSDGDEGLLVNAIGSYAGTHLINIYEGTTTSSFEINADSDWKLVVADLKELPESASKISGKGDAVVLFAAGNSRAKVNYKGEGNFVVIGYGGDGADLAVNEIGDYSGTVRLDPGLVQVKAEGPWTITGS